jgi:dolichyl-phosphate beta-glucosyltransferase
MILSIVIPAYNEARRLPQYLEQIKQHCWRRGLSYEVVVVDDGSTDETYPALVDISHKWPELRMVRHARNRGRGEAIRTGTKAARGDYILCADADGATPIEEESRLRTALEQGADIAVGSRTALHERVIRHRVWVRYIVGKVFALLVRVLVRVPVGDTQCGFKMWRRDVGKELVLMCQDSHWLFDLELIAIAHYLGYRIAEIPVTWSEMAGSKVRLVYDSWHMLWGLRSIRRVIKKLAAGGV